MPNMLILWRKFRAEGEIFYGIDEERRNREFREIREFREFKEGATFNEDEKDDRTTTKLKHQKK